MIMGTEEEHDPHDSKLFNCYLCGALSLPQTINNEQESIRTYITVTLILSFFKCWDQNKGLSISFFINPTDLLLFITIILFQLCFLQDQSDSAFGSLKRALWESLCFFCCAHILLCNFFSLIILKNCEGAEDGERDINTEDSILECVLTHAVTAIKTNLIDIINDKEAEL